MSIARQVVGAWAVALAALRPGMVQAQASAADKVAVSASPSRWGFGAVALATSFGSRDGVDNAPADPVIGGGAELRYMSRTFTIAAGPMLASLEDESGFDDKLVRFGLFFDLSYNLVKGATTRVYAGPTMDAYLSGDDGGSFAANESLVLFALHLGVAQRIGRHLALHVQAEPGIGMRASSDGPAFGLGTKAGLFFF